MPIPWQAMDPQDRADELALKNKQTSQYQWVEDDTTSYGSSGRTISKPTIERSVRNNTTQYGTQAGATAQPEYDTDEMLQKYMTYMEGIEDLTNPDIKITSSGETLDIDGASLKTTTKEAESSENFLTRALEVFVAPFEWVQSNVINPALSIGLGGFIPNLERGEGEDYFEWKKREWDAWKTAGVDIGSFRIDVKGALEFLPWLLIPNVGSFGTKIMTSGLKTISKQSAKSIKKAIAKGTTTAKVYEYNGINYLKEKGTMALVARTVGQTLRYSPWGLSEKAMEATIKPVLSKLGKAADQVGEAISAKVYGDVPLDVLNPSIMRFTEGFPDDFGKYIKKREALERERIKTVYKKSQMIQQAYNAGKITQEKYSKLLAAAAKGKTPDVKLPEGTVFKYANDVRVLREAVSGSNKLTVLERRKALTALDSMLDPEFAIFTGNIATAGDFKLLYKVLGKDFQKVAAKWLHEPTTTGAKIVDWLNLPRATMASMDLSMTFRQGLLLSIQHPVIAARAFGKQTKAFASEKWWKEQNDVLIQRKTYQEALVDGLPSIDIDGAMWQRQEGFMSELSKRLPFVKRSERAAATYLNELMFGAYEANVPLMKAMGASASEVTKFTQMLGALAGRGTFPKSFEKYLPMLNSMLFSPRLQLSRLQVLQSMASKNKYVRDYATKAFVKFMGGGLTLLSALNITGLGTFVWNDPRSSDFGKLVIGDTRLDIWTGYAQYARFAAQLLTGESTSASGYTYGKGRGETVGKFIQSKSSPAAGLIIDLFVGEDYEGDPLFSDTGELIEQVYERFTPLFVQSLREAHEIGGINAALLTIPEGFGIGAITYGNDVLIVKNKIANSMGLDSWDDIDPLTQKKISASNNDLISAQAEYDHRMMGSQWGDWILAGNAAEEEFEERIDLACLEFRDTGDGYTFREKVNQAFAGRNFAYDTREKDERFQEIVDIINLPNDDTFEAKAAAMGAEQLAILMYQKMLYSDDMFDQYKNYNFALAEERRAQLKEILPEGLFDYVEEYNGLKYDNLPAEYQDLVKARTVLKEYWDLEDMGTMYFGEGDSKAKDRFISKQRASLRKRNREVDYYYRLYYLRS